MITEYDMIWNDTTWNHTISNDNMKLDNMKWPVTKWQKKKSNCQQDEEKKPFLRPLGEARGQKVGSFGYK